jgi:hypothetical protein
MGLARELARQEDRSFYQGRDHVGMRRVSQVRVHGGGQHYGYKGNVQRAVSESPVHHIKKSPL